MQKKGRKEAEEEGKKRGKKDDSLDVQMCKQFNSKNPAQ